MEGHRYEAQKRENDAGVLNAERAGSGIVRGWPMHAVFEFTDACNLHCFMCGFEMLRDELRAVGQTRFTMPVDMFRMIATKAFPHIRTVNPTLGGEPLLLPYFEELLETIEHYGCKLEIFTNGMLLRGERLHKMMPHLQRLTVSFDGGTKETFEHVREGAVFEQIVDNVAGFARLRRELGLQNTIKFCFNVVLMRENVHELPRIMEIAAEHDVDFVSACYMIVTHPRIRASSPFHVPEETNRALAEAQVIAERHGIETEMPAPLPDDAAASLPASAPPLSDAPAPAPQEVAVQPSPEQSQATTSSCGSGGGSCASAEPPLAEAPAPAAPMSRPPDYHGAYYCDMPWRRVFVGLNGEVAPCCGPDRPIVGNGFQQDFEEIWNGEEYQRLRRGLYTGELTDYCRKCPYLQKAGVLPYE